MKELFIVAKNAFTVSAPDGLPAWEAIEWRYRLFAAASAQKPVFEAEICVGAIPEYDAEMIYEPEHAGIGFITSRASRLSNGSLILDFMHIEDSVLRLRMKMSPALDRAEIVLAPGGDSNDTFFLTHALMIAFMLATCGNGTLLIHASSVLFGGKAYLFQGKSGTGKSTHASLWVHNIAGAELLNDDNPVIRFKDDGVAMAYGSPWSGKTHCYRNVAAPIGAFVRIVRAKENVLQGLSPLRAYASLTASVFFMPFLGDGLREKRHRTLERLAGAVPCREMHCRPDADAALTCMRGLLFNGNN